jgi:transcription elongation factor Elf1
MDSKKPIVPSEPEPIVTTLRPAGKPGDELLKVATAQPVVFTVQAQGFKFNCPHCGHDCAFSALVQEQKVIIKHMAEKKEVAFLGCPKCGKDFRVGAATLVAPVTSMSDVNKALAEIKKKNPELVGSNRHVRRAAAAGLKIVGRPLNGGSR